MEKALHIAMINVTRIIQEISELKAEGVSKSETLKALDVYRTSYYGWLDPYKAIKEATLSTTFYLAREAVDYS